jgi:hypothetical protein
MKSLHNAVLTALLIALPVSCAQTHSSVDTDDLGTVRNTLTTTGAQHDFLDGIAGEFDVIYNVWTDSNRPCVTYTGTVDYQWNGESTILVGQHDGLWGDLPFNSAMLICFDSANSNYAMGWARADGTLVQPLSPTDPYAPDREFSVSRGSGDTCSRSVLILDSSNCHTFKQYVTTDDGYEELVMELICTRL